MKLPFRFGVLALYCSAAAACGKAYVRVDATIKEADAGPQPRDVRSTEAYRAIVTRTKTVAFRLPDSCVRETASQATGTSGRSDAILTTDCGVWLAELERAVTQDGYHVVSWAALHTLENRKSIPLYQAAQQLGVDLIFILNSLEANDTVEGKSVKATFTYFDSDPSGESGQALIPDSESKQAMLPVIAAHLCVELPQLQCPGAKLAVAEGQHAVALTATLDVTAVSNTGESVWFYRWGVSKILAQINKKAYLFRGRGRWWRPVAPRLPSTNDEYGAVAASDRKVTPGRDGLTDSMKGATESRKVDKYRTEKFELVRTVAKDLVANFHSGAR